MNRQRRQSEYDKRADRALARLSEMIVNDRGDGIVIVREDGPPIVTDHGVARKLGLGIAVETIESERSRHVGRFPAIIVVDDRNAVAWLPCYPLASGGNA